jgi:hypothetical protein
MPVTRAPSLGKVVTQRLIQEQRPREEPNQQYGYEAPRSLEHPVLVQEPLKMLTHKIESEEFRIDPADNKVPGSRNGQKQNATGGQINCPDNFPVV